MKKISSAEQMRILGGFNASTCRLLVYMANADGAGWTKEQWDGWAKLFENNC